MVIGAVPLPSALVMFLERVLTVAGLQGCYVTSVARTPERQAKAMLDNLRSKEPDEQGRVGFAKQYAIYKNAGDEVLRIAQANWHLSESEEGRRRLLDMMTAKIAENPGAVSHHCLPADSPLIVCDIRKNSVLNHNRFLNALKADSQLAKVLDENNVFHVEMWKTVTSGPSGSGQTTART